MSKKLARFRVQNWLLTCDEQVKDFDFFISGGSNGDLGGALVFREFSDDPWYQVGILSSFTGKFDEKKPGVYTKVEPFLPWIESKLEP